MPPLVAVARRRCRSTLIAARARALAPLRPATGTALLASASALTHAAALGATGGAAAAPALAWGAALSGAVRVDDGVVEGGEISVHYDPMIAKVRARAGRLAASHRTSLRRICFRS